MHLYKMKRFDTLSLVMEKTSCDVNLELQFMLTLPAAPLLNSRCHYCKDNGVLKHTYNLFVLYMILSPNSNLLGSLQVFHVVKSYQFASLETEFMFRNFEGEFFFYGHLKNALFVVIIFLGHQLVTESFLFISGLHQMSRQKCLSCYTKYFTKTGGTSSKPQF